MSADTRKEGLVVASIILVNVSLWSLERRLTRLETAPRAEGGR